MTVVAVGRCSESVGHVALQRAVEYKTKCHEVCWPASLLCAVVDRHHGCVLVVCVSEESTSMGLLRRWRDARSWIAWIDGQVVERFTRRCGFAASTTTARVLIVSWSGYTGLRVQAQISSQPFPQNAARAETKTRQHLMPSSPQASGLTQKCTQFVVRPPMWEKVL